MSLLSLLAPGYALKRKTAQHYLRSYEAAMPGRTRSQMRRSVGDGDNAAAPSLLTLREQARHLDENHDLARGALNVLVQNVIGKGIRISPQIKDISGDPVDDLNRRLMSLFRQWTEHPDVTGNYGWGQAQRLLARTLYRDGEALCKLISGDITSLNHRTNVPFSIELAEPDILDESYDDPARRIIQGVEKNGWGRSVAYHIHKTHPGSYRGYMVAAADLVRIPADNMLHLTCVDRIGQTRGVSKFAAVLTRLQDIKEYEESERVAARVAAAYCGYIKRHEDISGDDSVRKQSGCRELHMVPGIIMDDLRPGEDIGMISPNRPNSGLEAFRDGQMRAAASGVGVSYSSLSKNYNGTYSAQRQELVEQYGHYEMLREEFVSVCLAPIWRRFVDVARLVIGHRMFIGIDPLTLYHADFIGPARPWIDPKKEIEADILRISSGISSRHQIIQERGGNPEDLRAQINRERMQDTADGVVFAVPVAGDAQEKPNKKDDKEDR